MTLLLAINSASEFGHQQVVHAAFAPPQHILRASTLSSRRRKVYFCVSKGISYYTLSAAKVFNPPPYHGDAPSYVLTPRLPPSYTIIPPEEWMSSTPRNGYLPWQNSIIPPGSLVRIRAIGRYWNRLGYVIGASNNPQNECALVAVVPIIIYPTNHATRNISPPAKRRKLNTSKISDNHQVAPRTPWLFTPHLLQSRLLTENVPEGSHHCRVTTYEEAAEDLQQFFSGQFPDRHSDSITYKMEFDGFSWAVRRYGKSVTDMPNAKEPATDVLQKAMPIQRYRGHFYYFGMRIVPIYRSAALTFNHILEPDEVLPFVEARIAPTFFDPLISQMHWKQRDKLVDVVQQEWHRYPFYRIHIVDVVGGTVVAHQVQSPENKKDAMECHADGLLVDANRLPYEYAISNFWLRLVTGDHVRVIAGENKGRCGTVLFTEEYIADIVPYDSTPQVV